MLQVSGHMLDSRDAVSDGWLVVCIWYKMEVDLRGARYFEEGSESWWDKGDETRFVDGVPDFW